VILRPIVGIIDERSSFSLSCSLPKV
jgi:hypothetical protein